jgi:hypothetical protein
MAVRIHASIHGGQVGIVCEGSGVHLRNGISRQIPAQSPAKVTSPTIYLTNALKKKEDKRAQYELFNRYSVLFAQCSQSREGECICLDDTDGVEAQIPAKMCTSKLGSRVCKDTHAQGEYYDTCSSQVKCADTTVQHGEADKAWTKRFCGNGPQCHSRHISASVHRVTCRVAYQADSVRIKYSYNVRSCVRGSNGLKDIIPTFPLRFLRMNIIQPGR